MQKYPKWKKRSRTIAYIRVSTSGQDTKKNKADILMMANDKNLGRVRFVEEKASGKKSWKENKSLKL
jgi:DNA invertase Pin-like site-specific DNA recombinase